MNNFEASLLDLARILLTCPDRGLITPWFPVRVVMADLATPAATPRFQRTRALAWRDPVPSPEAKWVHP